MLSAKSPSVHKVTYVHKLYRGIDKARVLQHRASVAQQLSEETTDDHSGTAAGKVKKKSLKKTP